MSTTPTPTPCCEYCGTTAYIYPVERDFWACGSKVNASDNHERSTNCRVLEASRLKREIAIQKQLRADDVAELNARLIQRREDYAAHSIKQAQELQTLRVQLEQSVPIRDVIPVLQAANHVCDDEAAYGLAELDKALAAFASKHP